MCVWGGLNEKGSKIEGTSRERKSKERGWLGGKGLSGGKELKRKGRGLPERRTNDREGNPYN